MNKLWTRFNEAVECLSKHDKLGVVVFQFFQNFHPTAENAAYIGYLRRMLYPTAKMACEMRSRDWFTEEHLEDTLKLMRKHNIILIACDDLEHEMLPHGQVCCNQLTKAFLMKTILVSRVYIYMYIMFCFLLYDCVSASTSPQRGTSAPAHSFAPHEFRWGVRACAQTNGDRAAAQ